MHAALVEHANKVADGWAKDGAAAIASHSHAIDDYGVCLQIGQYVTFDRDGALHAFYRWWIAGDGTLWRIGETASQLVDREKLAEDVAQVQDSFRRL